MNGPPRPLPGRRVLLDLGFAALVAFAAWHGLAGRHALHGDGAEYILQTQALAFRGELRIDTERLIDYWNRTNPYGLTLEPPRPVSLPLTEDSQAGGHWGGLYPDRFGDRRYYHFWLYSLAAAPVYLLFHVLAGAPFEYHAFRALNVACLLLPLVLVWVRRREGWALPVMALALFSPLIPYADWHQSELFCWALVVSAFWLAASERARLTAPLLVGLAAAQNPPIALFLPLHAAYLLRTLAAAGRPVRWGRLAAAYAGAGFLAASSLLYFRYCFGEWSVIEAIGLASSRFATLSRAADVFLSPAIGAVWLFPTVFLFLPFRLRRSNALWLAGALLSAFAAAYLASATRNFNSGQVGSLRYTVWILAPLWYFVLDAGGRPSPVPGWRRGLWWAALVLNLAAVWVFKYERLPRKDIRRVGGAWRGVPEVAAVYAVTRYADDPEILVENIRHREIPHPGAFNGVDVWNLNDRLSLWVISSRVAGPEPAARWNRRTVPAYRTVPAGHTLFVATNGVLEVRVPETTRFAIHPYLGGYLLAWVDARADSVDGDVPICVR